MSHRPPRPASSAEPAQWLMERVDMWHGDWATGMVGPGFEAYARLFHPPGEGTWAEVAAGNGRTLHPSAEWEAISAPGPYRREDWGESRGAAGAPRIGEVEAETLGTLCDVLARHTSTPEQCFFAVWEGRAFLQPVTASASAYSIRAGVDPDSIQLPGPAPAEWQLDLTGPRFPMPGRNTYYLFEGEVHDALRSGRWHNEQWFIAGSPNWMWAADHAWCVGTEVDYDSTFIGGRQVLINELCASAQVEVLQIAPDAPALDHVNL